MDLLAAWLLFPLALGATCLGLGLLIERLAAWRMPGTLLLPVGLAGLIALARLITFEPETARLALPVIGALALAGLVLGRDRLRGLRPDPWLAAAALAVFAVFAAPTVLSGEPTFAGYLALPDTSHQLSLAHLFAHHGPDYMALPDGANRLSMAGYVVTSYPVAAQVALGVMAPLGVLDLAWLYQPFLTVTALAAFLALTSLVAPLFARRWQAAVTAFVAAQSALVVGSALQGSIKELAAMAMLVTAAAVIAAAARERRPARSLLPLGVVAAAALGSLGPAALGYLAVAALVVLAVFGARLARERRLSDALWLVAGVALAAILAIPILDTIQTAIDANTAVLDAGAGAGVGAGDTGAALGHLAGPLDTAQALGVWLSGDFRYSPASFHTIHDILLVVAGALAILGLLWAVRRRAWGPLLLLAIVGPISLYLLSRGSPYADSKVLMIVSPALLLLAMLGAASLWKPLSVVATVVLAAGVLGSNALAYHEVSLAPHDRYEELLGLNDRLAGKGPAIFTEYDEFGKYFLRDVPGYNQPEYPHGYRPAGPGEQSPLFDPKRRPSLKTPLDPDDLTLAYMESVPYMVVRRSPISSRPPASFRRVWRGDYYDLWRRGRSPRVLSHKPLGPDFFRPAAVVDRATARSWGRRALRLKGRLAVVPRDRSASVRPGDVRHSIGWTSFPIYPGALVTAGPGLLTAPVRVARTGRYQVWMEGSFARRLSLRLDGRLVGQTRGGLENPGAYARMGIVGLRRGAHRLEVRQGGGDLRPGNAGYRSSLRHIGPIVLNPERDERGRVATYDAGDWRRLIGIRADWLEIVRR